MRLDIGFSCFVRGSGLPLIRQNAIGIDPASRCGFQDDPPDGAGATTALHPAPQALMNPAWAERLFARCRRHEPDLVVAQDIAGADDHSLGRDVNGPAEMLNAHKDAQS
jgi:hypothetical protein